MTNEDIISECQERGLNIGEDMFQPGLFELQILDEETGCLLVRAYVETFPSHPLLDAIIDYTQTWQIIEPEDPADEYIQDICTDVYNALKEMEGE